MNGKRAIWYDSRYTPGNVVGEISPRGKRIGHQHVRTKGQARRIVRFMRAKCKALGIRERQSFWVPVILGCGELTAERTYRDGSREGYRGRTEPGGWSWAKWRRYCQEVYG